MKISAIIACVIGLVFQLNAHEVITESSASESLSSAEFQEEPQLQELSLLVSLKDLDFNQEGISVNVGERSYAVHSLKQQGNQWIAKIAAVRCPWGHSLCGICKLCHKRICPDWQPRTAQCAAVE